MLDRLLQPDALADPYAVYAELRDRAEPWRPSKREVVFATHADVHAVLRDPRFGKPQLPWMALKTVRVLFQMFLMLDPPAHTRLRRVVSSCFSPPAVAALRDRVEAVAASLLQGRASMDVMTDFAYQLPMEVISDLLGVPPDERATLSEWSRQQTEYLDSPLPFTVADGVAMAKAAITGKSKPVATLRAAARMVACARRCLDAAAAADDPGPLLRSLVEARRDGVISGDEAAATWVMLVIAGHETTANLVGNGLHALLQHPEAMDNLRAHPTLLPGAVEECLRFDSPIPLLARVANEDVEVGDTRVAKGQFVHLVVASANRDPQVFTEPERFDISRPPQPAHLGFGHGIHYCVGAALARVEGTAALGALVARRPVLVSAEWRKAVAVRGLRSLRVEFAA